MIITFCGHATYIEKEGDRESLLSLLKKIIQERPVLFYLGGYGNFDSFALSVAMKYRKAHSDARIIFITPYMSEEYLKSKYDPYIYDEVLYPPLETVPYKFAISKRNEWMASEADCIISYVKRRYGGAYAMFLYAKRKNKPIYNLFEVTGGK